MRVYGEEKGRDKWMTDRKQKLRGDKIRKYI